MGSASISIVKGKGSVNHNNRVFKTENVDVNRTPNNITYVSEPLETAYQKCFGAAIEEYNAKQNRADRKIDGVSGYMQQLRQSKNGEKLFYENVVQVGNMNDSRVGTKQGNDCKVILDKYMKEFAAANPNLYVFNAVMHLDEQTPHLHIDYIPLATGYQRGLNVRNSLDRAFKQQGIDGAANKFQNSTVEWQHREKDRLGEIMRFYGLERKEETGLKRQHKTVDHYKAIAAETKNQIEALPEQISSSPSIVNKEKVTVKKDDLSLLEQRAKLTTVHDEAARKIEAEAEMKLAAATKLESQAGELKVFYFDKYSEQLKLNLEHKQLVTVCAEQQQTITELTKEVNSLRKQVDLLKSAVVAAFDKLRNVVKAIRELKFDKTGEYKIKGMSEEQSALIDGVTKYAADSAENVGLKDIAENIRTKYGVGKDIQEVISDNRYSRDYER